MKIRWARVVAVVAVGILVFRECRQADPQSLYGSSDEKLDRAMETIAALQTTESSVQNPQARNGNLIATESALKETQAALVATQPARPLPPVSGGDPVNVPPTPGTDASTRSDVPNGQFVPHNMNPWVASTFDTTRGGPDNLIFHHTSNIGDSDESTYWLSGVGDVVGSWVSLSLKQPATLTGIRMFFASRDVTCYHQPRDVLFVFSDSSDFVNTSNQNVQFDEPEDTSWQFRPLAPVLASNVRLHVDSTASPSNTSCAGDQVQIHGMQFYGNN